jgi:hypothetical protein
VVLIRLDKWQKPCSDPKVSQNTERMHKSQEFRQRKKGDLGGEGQSKERAVFFPITRRTEFHGLARGYLTLGEKGADVALCDRSQMGNRYIDDGNKVKAH